MICFWLKDHDKAVEAVGLKRSLFHIIQKVCAVAGLDPFSSADGNLDNSRGNYGRYGRQHSCYGGGDLNYVESFRSIPWPEAMFNEKRFNVLPRWIY